MLAFGGYLTVYGFINYFARNLDTLLIGWKWGANPVGLYSRAYALLLLPIGQITAPFSSVAVPALSRLQDDPLEFSKFYFKMVRVIAFVSMPIVVIMSLLSGEIITTVLGKQWAAASEIFQVLAFAAFWQPIASTVGWVYVSLGRVKRMMYWGFIGTFVMGGFILAGLDGGAIGVAKYYAISMWILVIPIFGYAFYGTSLKLRTLLTTIALPLFNTMIVGVCFYVSKTFFSTEEEALRLIYVCLSSFVIYLPIFYLVKPLRIEVLAYFKVIRNK